MTKREGPGKDESPAPDNLGSKRPHATLDLKATEIGTGTKDAKDTKAAPAAAAQPNPTATSGPAQPASGTKPAAESAAPKTGVPPKSDTARPTPTGASAGSRPPQPQTAPSGAFGRFLGHLTAGVAGGLLTFAGLSAVQPQNTDTTDIAALTETTESLRQRLDKITATADAQSSSTAGLSAKLTDAESRLLKLDKVDQSIGALSSSLTKLASDQAAIDKRLKEASAEGGPSARIAKLEDQLATLSAAAANTPQDGRIPQLAAVTGKISDLETTIASQTDALRKTVLEELDKRTGEIREQSEAARSATVRFDRDLAQVKTDAARLGQQLEIAKANSERVDNEIRAFRETAATLSATVDGLKNDVEARFRATARPADVTSAVAPLTDRVASLESDVKAVVTGEDNRKANAERIVLSLGLANLKRLLDAGHGYANELAGVKKTAGDKLDLSVLERFKDDGVPTIPDLVRDFRPMANAVIDAGTEPGSGSMIDRLLSGAKSVIRVRRVNHDASDQSIEAILGRMETALKDERLNDVLSEAGKLPPSAAQPAQDWISKVEARVSVDRAVAGIEQQLKASLTGTDVKTTNGAVQ